MILNFVKIFTQDGLQLDGFLAKPSLTAKPPRPTKRAILFIHGLGGRFYSSEIVALAEACQKSGLALASFGNRGHGMVTSFRNPKGKRILGGMGFEKFEHCVFDIKAMIDFLAKQGYKKIYLVGSSTGSNKSLYYIYKTGDKRVSGLALVAPVSDVSAQMKLLGKKFWPILAKVKKFARRHPGQVLPQSISAKIMTPERYLSLNQAGGAEDVFPYYRKGAKFKELNSVTAPMLVVLGGRDQFLDRSARQLLTIFQRNALAAKNFQGEIIAGADHSFNKKEKILAQVLVGWVKKVG